ncbi:MAG: hypothetical protein LBQ06_00295, partial [Frankiaceae bacterium]|nr:hypothetical protein [Frankiaceae bacterium]
MSGSEVLETGCAPAGDRPAGGRPAIDAERAPDPRATVDGRPAGDGDCGRDTAAAAAAAGRSLVRYARPDLERMSAAILADRASGSTLGELAARHGVSIWAVRQVLTA